MGKAAEGERASDWSFTESLTLDDVELREREAIVDGEVFQVSYAHSIQGRVVSKITYRQLRKICAYLGVRYYKNRPKNVMTELIAQKKLKGQVPESYKLVKKTKNPQPVVDELEEMGPETENDDDMEHDADMEDQDPATEENQDTTVEETQDNTEEEETHPLFIGPSKRQRLATDDEMIVTSSSATNTFLQPVSPTVPEPQHSPDYESGIPTTPVESERPRGTREQMSLRDRIDTFNLLLHVQHQIQRIEHELCTNGATQSVPTSRTQRLEEDLHFYLEERRSLMQHLELSR